MGTVCRTVGVFRMWMRPVVFLFRKHLARTSLLEFDNVNVGKSAEFGIFYEGNEEERITDVKVTNFNVENAKWPYYLHNTKNCTFINCKVNNQPIPEAPEDSKVKRTCDVW